MHKKEKYENNKTNEKEKRMNKTRLVSLEAVYISRLLGKESKEKNIINIGNKITIKSKE